MISKQQFLNVMSARSGYACNCQDDEDTEELSAMVGITPSEHDNDETEEARDNNEKDFNELIAAAIESEDDDDEIEDGNDDDDDGGEPVTNADLREIAMMLGLDDE